MNPASLVACALLALPLAAATPAAGPAIAHPVAEVVPAASHAPAQVIQPEGMPGDRFASSDEPCVVPAGAAGGAAADSEPDALLSQCGQLRTPVPGPSGRGEARRGADLPGWCVLPVVHQGDPVGEPCPGPRGRVELRIAPLQSR